MLEIVYQDEWLVAINKPHGLLVHRSPIAADAQEFALQILRDQIGQPVHPVHRLDRKTSGLLLFALDKDTLSIMQKQFALQDKTINKKYVAIVRGWIEEEGEIDYALFNDNGKEQNAVTIFKKIAQAELDIPSGKFQTSRYSLVEAEPVTGRMHQLRKHFSHLFHPIIGDRPHGCNKQNKIFKEQYNMTTMMLHAYCLGFKHPVSGKEILLRAEMSNEFKRMVKLMGWESEVDGLMSAIK